MPKDWNRMSIQERRRYCKEVWNSAYDPRTDQCVNWVSPDPWKSSEERLKKLKPGESACFIATAVYGSSEADEVIILRSFRDNFLLGNLIGKAFVNLYYKWSPHTINYIKKHNLIAALLKMILNRIVRIIKIF